MNKPDGVAKRDPNFATIDSDKGTQWYDLSSLPLAEEHEPLLRTLLG